MPDFMTSQLTEIEQERKYWDKAAKDPDVNRKYISSVDTETSIDQIMPYLKRGNVLEIGCGVGRLTTAIADIIPDTQIFGIDVSKEMLNLAPPSVVSYQQNDGRTIPFPDNYFDSIYSMLVFQHIPDAVKKNYIKEAYRSLKMTGILHVQFVTGKHKGFVDYNITINEMVKCFKKTGFEIIALKEGTIHPEWAWITGIKT